MKQIEGSAIHTTGHFKPPQTLQGAQHIMALTKGIPTLTDHPTIVVPPLSDGPFQGWGTRIG